MKERFPKIKSLARHAHGAGWTASSALLGAGFLAMSPLNLGAADPWGAVAEFRFDGETRNWVAPHQPIEADGITFTVDRFGSLRGAAMFPDSGFVGSMQRDHVRNRTQWSWTGWILASSVDLENRIIYSENAAGNCFDITLHLDTIKVRTWNEDMPQKWAAAIATQPVRPGVWQHVAVTFESPDGSFGTCTIYQDGEVSFFGQLPAVKVSSPPPGSSAFALGSNIGHWTVGQVDQMFVGAIDDCLIFDRALTAAEIPATMEPNKRLRAFVAVEIEFFAELGKTYQLQRSDDLQTWVNDGDAIVGEGQPVSGLFSAREGQKKHWRIQEAD